MSLSQIIPEEIIECRLKAKITLQQCENRQNKYPRVNTQGITEPMFLSCKECKHWLPKDHKHHRKVGGIWNQKKHYQEW
jgi:hypothetical protein